MKESERKRKIVKESERKRKQGEAGDEYGVRDTLNSPDDVENQLKLLCSEGTLLQVNEGKHSRYYCK